MSWSSTDQSTPRMGDGSERYEGECGMNILAAPGVRGAALLDALRTSMQDLSNARGAGGSPIEQLNRYQRWANEQVRARTIAEVSGG